LLLTCSDIALADDCQLIIEANDLLQFNMRSLQVSAECPQVEVVLKHVGKQTAHVIGHDWVLAHTADVAALTSAGVVAGFDRGYLPAGDPRILAATQIVGGGERTSVTFSTAGLTAGGDYTFFCSYPGHAMLMRGRFVFGNQERFASRGAKSVGPVTRAGAQTGRP
jgi:azurin